jgi:hypothetical protein
VGAGLGPEPEPAAARAVAGRAPAAGGARRAAEVSANSGARAAREGSPVAVAMLCGNSRRAVLLARVEYALCYDYPLSKLLLIGISVGRRGPAEWAHRLSFLPGNCPRHGKPPLLRPACRTSRSPPRLGGRLAALECGGKICCLSHLGGNGYGSPGTLERFSTRLSDS